MRRLLKGLTGLVIVVGMAAGGLYWQEHRSSDSDPGRTTVSTTFGDWVVRCVEREAALPCEMSQQLVDGKSGQMMTRFSIAWSPAEDRHALQIALPLGVWLEPGVTLSVGELNVEGIQYSRCLPRGCMIEAALEDPMLSELKTAEKGQLTIFDRTHQPIGLPFSLKGFASAEAGLRRTTKEMSREPLTIARTVAVITAWMRKEDASGSSGGSSANIIEMEE